MGCVSDRHRIDSGIREGDYQAYETNSNKVMYIGIRTVAKK
jgi:hypothetical protein